MTRSVFFPLCALLLFLCTVYMLDAQPRRSCGTMESLEHQIESNPSVAYRMRQIEQSTQMRARSAFGEAVGTIMIPVVVHVIYRNDAENISDAQIRSQLQVLNRDFGRYNPDTAYTDPIFQPLAANPGIQFQLANVDPEGNPSTGITRTRTNRFGFSADDNGMKYSAMGGKDAWAPGEYLNIWVCNISGGMLGYSQFPGAAPETDGVVISYPFFGTMGAVTPPFDQGRTTTHEVGHWLNLRHIWGDGPCGVDDFVEDTPDADQPHHGCPEQTYSCDGPNMVQNFMDYTDDACMNFFTQGQVRRMRALFVPGGARESLLRSRGLRTSLPANEYTEAGPPSSLDATELTATEARLSWKSMPGALSYDVRMRLEGYNWQAKTVTDPFVKVNRLRSCADYEFQVEALYASRRSEASEIYRFSTICEPTTSLMRAPEGLSVLPSGVNVQLRWMAVAGATSYQVQYKADDGSQALSRTVRETSTLIPNPVAGRRYFWRVRANLPSGVSDWSKVMAFQPSLAAVSRTASGTSALEPFSAYWERPGQRISLSFPVSASMVVQARLIDPAGLVARDFGSVTLLPNSSLGLDGGDLPPKSYRLLLTDDAGFEYEGAVK